MRKIKLITDTMQRMHSVVSIEVEAPLSDRLESWNAEYCKANRLGLGCDDTKDMRIALVDRYLHIVRYSLASQLASHGVLESPPRPSVLSLNLNEIADALWVPFYDDIEAIEEDFTSEDNPAYLEYLYAAAEEVFEAGKMSLYRSVNENFSAWGVFLNDVHKELYNAAKAHGIVAYLANMDTLYAPSEKEKVVVTGVTELPEYTHRFAVNDKTKDEITSNLNWVTMSPIWSSDYIVTVNGKFALASELVISDGDDICIYEVSG